MRIFALPEVGNGKFRTDKGTSSIDALDKVIPLDIHILNAIILDGRGIVDEDIESSKNFDSLLNGSFDAFLIPDIDLQGQALATSLLDLFSSSVDRAFQLRLRGHCFGGNHDVCTVTGTAFCNCKADASRSSGDENGLSFEAAEFRLCEVEWDESFESPHRHSL